MFFCSFHSSKLLCFSLNTRGQTSRNQNLASIDASLYYVLLYLHPNTCGRLGSTSNVQRCHNGGGSASWDLGRQKKILQDVTVAT